MLGKMIGYEKRFPTASCEDWTHDPWFTRPVLYHWAKEAHISRRKFLQIIILASYEEQKKEMPPERIELSTPGLQDQCSATEL